MARQPRRVGMMATAILGAMVLAGCGADDFDSADDGTAGGGEPDAAREAAPDRDPPAAQEQGADHDASGEAGGIVDTRSIIYTGELTVRVEDVDAAADTTADTAGRHGGFVGGDRRTVDDDRSSATLTLRIPSENFANAVSDLGDLGDEESREIQTEDVTDEVVDLETRLATARTSVERTRALLEEAESIADIVEVEAELSTREERLARLQAQQRTLEDLVALSTITVRLLGPEAEEEDDPEAGFLAGLGAGWNAFTTSATVLVTVLGAVLPFLVAIGVPAAAVVWLARRRGRRVRPATPADQEA